MTLLSIYLVNVSLLSLFVCLTPLIFPAGCAVSGGRAVVLGGENDKGVLKSVELYHPVKKNWINLAPMQQERHSFGAVSVGSSIFAIGGRDASGNHGRVLKSVEGLSLVAMASPTHAGSSHSLLSSSSSSSAQLGGGGRRIRKLFFELCLISAELRKGRSRDDIRRGRRPIN